MVHNIHFRRKLYHGTASQKSRQKSQFHTFRVNQPSFPLFFHPLQFLPSITECGSEHFFYAKITPWYNIQIITSEKSFSRISPKSAFIPTFFQPLQFLPSNTKCGQEHLSYAEITKWYIIQKLTTKKEKDLKTRHQNCSFADEF